jgi:hypothetical protein
VTNDARNEQRGRENVKEYASTQSRIKIFMNLLGRLWFGKQNIQSGYGMVEPLTTFS